MRTSKSRSRSKSNRNRSMGNVVNRVFDSSGPEGKVRGTPQQIIDKYNLMARDAQLSNDRVAAENFQQHAEHYLRMLAEAQREQAERQAQQQERRGAHQGATRADEKADETAVADGGQVTVSTPEIAPAAVTSDVMGVAPGDSELVDTPEENVVPPRKPRPPRNPTPLDEPALAASDAAE
ncbi:MAG: DUF4167 domain-containing protein [Boseongicola sp.]|nr:DUF4167 domain-containing protein [Boseongicola sp.]